MLELFKKFSGFSGGVFIFGAVLVTLGLTNGIQDLGISVASGCRPWSVVCGMIFCAVSIALFFLGPKTKLDINKLSPTQKSMLEFISIEYKQRGTVSQDQVEKEFHKIPKDELYYRLEHLVLSHYLTKDAIGSIDGVKQRFTYKLSSAYRSMAEIPFIKPDDNYTPSEKAP